MKKLLALVLALVMTLSLCVTSNAAFAGEEYDYDEAVEVMAAVGVFQGDENGKFNGKAELTREQAAKLIAYLDLGEKVAEALPAVKVFNDVEATRWSAKYVAYCADAGYLAGVGDNNFDPAGKLTGYAFGKMLLCVLGFDAAVEGFTGTNWSIAVAKLMQSNDIAKSVSGSASAVLTREQAAQYCLNALKADMVEYESKGTQITINGAVIATGATAAKTVANTKFDYRVDGELSEGNNTVKQLVEKLYPDMKLDNDDGTEDDFGRPAVTWYDEDGDEIGTYADTADYVLVAKKDTKLADLLEDNKLDKKLTKVGEGTVAEFESEMGDKWIEAGTVVELWVEKDTITDYTAYGYFVFEITKVEEVESDEDEFEKYGISKYYTVANLEGAEVEGTYIDAANDDYDGDAVAIGDFEEDDIVMVSYCWDTGEFADVVKASSFDSKVTKKNTNKVTAGGTEYAATADVAAFVNFDDTFTFYTDPNGVVIDVVVAEEADEALEYVYVIDAEAQGEEDGLISAKDNTAKVKVMYVDGTKTVVDYALTKVTAKNGVAGYEYEDSAYGGSKGTIAKGEYYFTFNGDKYEFTKAGFEAKVVEGWYAFTEKDDEITLKSADKEDVSKVEENTVTAAKDSTKLTEDGLRATSSTKLVVLDEDGLFKTYTGYKNFPKADANDEIANATALVVYGSSTSYAKTVYVYAGNTVSAAEEKIDVAMYVSTGDTTDDGVETTFVVDGEKKTYLLADALSDAEAGMLYEITIEDDDVSAEALTGEDYAKGVVEAVDETYVALVDVADSIKLADDCAVYSVAKDGKSVSKGTLAEEQNVVVFADDDGAYLIFIYKTALYGVLYAD